MRKQLRIHLNKTVNNSYDILIAENISLGQEIKKLNLPNHFAVITDSRVYQLYKKRLEQTFSASGLRFKFIVFPEGEKYKNLRTFEKITEKMLSLGFDRGSTVVAFGGGVTGDIAGYVAGTFMRGIPFIQVPTTLLAQVDSSIGGKVAVDLKKGKNSSGLFYQPVKVLIDISFLKTLKDDDFNNGMIEIIKHGIICDKKYFGSIGKNLNKILNRQADTLISLIHRSCQIKGSIVEKDEKEGGLRRILNFGHTIGHAVESISGYRIKHGYAVGLGIIKESEIAFKQNFLNESDLDTIKKTVKFFIPGIYDFPGEKILKRVIFDKKNKKAGDSLELSIPLILPRQIGRVTVKNFTVKELRLLL